MNRRHIVLGLASASALSASKAVAQTPPFTVFASGLKFPEGPVLLPDGDMLLSELSLGQIVRQGRDGQRTVIAMVGGTPAGVAIGPDGAIYVCNIGYLADDKRAAFPGQVQRIDPETRAVSTFVSAADGQALHGPDDMVFDAAGGFYFSDVGSYAPDRQTADLTGVYYFDGKTAHRCLSERTFATNGIGLSPDGARLYWTQYLTGRLFSRQIASPGVLKAPVKHNADCLYIHPAPLTYFDSLRVDAEGCVSVAVHDTSPTGKSGIMSFDPAGAPLAFVPFDDPVTTNVVFSWEGPKKAYVTLSATGQVVCLDWPRRGQPPRYALAPSLLRG